MIGIMLILMRYRRKERWLVCKRFDRMMWRWILDMFKLIRRMRGSRKKIRGGWGRK